MDASKEHKAFNEKFKLQELKVAQYGNWIISIRPVQATLGALVVSMNRPCLSFSEISPSEAQDLSIVYKKIESVLAVFVGFEKINYLSLMMVDSHLHFHVIPRYEGIRKFSDIEYQDYGWPKLPDLSRGEGDDEVLLNIKKELENLFDGKLK